MKQYFLFAVLSISMIVFATAFVKKETDYPDKHLEIVLRSIGDKVLLRSNDSSSRVLPIEKISGNTFRISFENSFEFMPDTLMSIVHQQLAKTDWPKDYIVSVKDCNQDKTLFTYELTTAAGDLKPCKGRVYPKGCYVIDISFPLKKSFNYSWLLLGLVPLAFAGIYYTRKPAKSSEPKAEKPEESSPNDTETDQTIPDYILLGNFKFFESKGILSINEETIELSDKESKALHILASNLNQVVGRDVLMKEIWEEEGVVVITRNVDVLISKLRKRLSADPAIKIMNVHGKGYKMIL
jgi:Transcriptional regulatory protein, C terminal